MTSWASVEGLPFPLGVIWIAEEGAYNYLVGPRSVVVLLRPKGGRG
jgi:hypothetical protein